MLNCLRCLKTKDVNFAQSFLAKTRCGKALGKDDTMVQHFEESETRMCSLLDFLTYVTKPHICALEDELEGIIINGIRIMLAGTLMSPFSDHELNRDSGTC